MEVCLSSQNFEFGISFNVMYGACQEFQGSVGTITPELATKSVVP